MSLGEKINQLIQANIKTWHKDTILKDRHNNLRTDLDMSSEERAKVFLDARKFNRERAKVKDEIDTICGEQTFSEKVNYYNEPKTNNN